MGISTTDIRMDTASSENRWRTLLAFLRQGYPLLHVRDEKTSGTAAGTFTSGARRTRVLNTEVANQITGASLASNQVTLPAGVYTFEGHAPAFFVALHRLSLRDTTNSVDLGLGENAYDQVGTVGTSAYIKGDFTLSAQAVIELQHECSVTRGTNGFGLPLTFGEVEVYASLFITQLSG